MAKHDKQQGSHNVADGDDVVGVQVGRVGGKGEKPKVGRPKRVTNVVSGNARVGCQVDEVHGAIDIRF